MNFTESLVELEKQMVEACEMVLTIGKDYARAKSLYESVQDKKEPTLCMLMDDEKSVSAAKKKAMSHPEYKTYLDGLSAVRERYLKWQVAYDHAKLMVEVYRTLISNRREELKNIR